MAFLLLEDFESCQGTDLECYFNSGSFTLSNFFFDKVNPYLHLLVSGGREGGREGEREGEDGREGERKGGREGGKGGRRRGGRMERGGGGMILCFALTLSGLH